jgi:hypothetical protein
MKNIKTVFITLVGLIYFSSCYYDVEQELYPNQGTCDTSNVSLSGVVRPILQDECYVCHSVSASGSLGAGINLETYSNLKAQVDNGKLLKSIKHESGASPMPKGSSAKIDACKILKIQTWIIRGAKND